MGSKPKFCMWHNDTKLHRSIDVFEGQYKVLDNKALRLSP